jgi:AcrR family transcriptional regulator
MDQRQRLLEAAIEALQDLGYARATTREIVARAGAHLPAINYYFGSKERLLHEAIVEALRRWAQTTLAVGEESEESASGRELLQGSVERFLATLESDRPYVVAAVEAFAQASRSEELRQRLADAYGELREFIARTAVDRGPDEDPEHGARTLDLASVLMALFDGLAIQWLLDPERAPSAAQAMGGLDALARGLLVPEQADG